MFYCQPCGDDRNWPEGWMKSRGPCELCGKVAICSDRPSSSLPLPMSLTPPRRRECGKTCMGTDPDLCRDMSDCLSLPSEADLAEQRAADAAH